MFFLNMGSTITFDYVSLKQYVFYLQGKSFVDISQKYTIYRIFTSLVYLLYYFPKGCGNKGPRLSD